MSSSWMPRGLLLSAVFVASAVPSSASAIRPFVTDDARVVGEAQLQLETWFVVDAAALEHNVLVAVGPTRWLELTLGAIHGGEFRGRRRGYSVIGPLLQTKILVVSAEDNRRPGLAVSLGALQPRAFGGFERPGWTGFGYLMVTQSLFREALLLHANLGVALGDERAAAVNRVRVLVTGGFGFQARVAAGFHAVAEVYYGDPFDPTSGFPAAQVGFRHIFSERVQIDGTFGTSLRPVQHDDDDTRGEFELWGTFGLRLVTERLWGEG